MNSNTRTTLSAATFFGLVAFVLSSAIFAGLFAMPTIVGFSLLAVSGMVEIAFLSYAEPHWIALRAERDEAVPAAPRAAPEVVAFPTYSANNDRAAA